MLSFTINQKEYLCPSGYGEITISEYATHMEVVAPLLPGQKQAPPQRKKKGMMARLSRKLNKKVEEIQNPLEGWDGQIAYEAAFLSHWLKCPPEVVDMLSDADIHATYVFINNQWQAWEPTPRIQSFTHAGRTWDIDYSLDALGGIPDYNNLQAVVSKICKSGTTTMGPRQWGGLPLSTATSIMVEIKRRHSNIATIVGHNILQYFKLNSNG